MKEKIQQKVYNSIDTLNLELDGDERIEKSLTTALFGSGSKLDSLGLINLIVAIEQDIEDEFETSITIADERALSQEQSPFRSIGSLIDYLDMILKEKLNDR
jgi:D-alanine--poly(phosphoribitol) ligase subunit 2